MAESSLGGRRDKEYRTSKTLNIRRNHLVFIAMGMKVVALFCSV
jgi:hypothetical protein